MSAAAAGIVNAAMNDIEHVAVEINVHGIERTEGCGSLIALAIVELRINNVDVCLQGVQVRVKHGRYLCQAPQFREPRSGRWLPCILLPPELSTAIGASVTDAMQRLDEALPPPLAEAAMEAVT